MDLQELQETIITGSSGTGIRIGDVVTIYPKEILARIRRENQQYERTVAYEFRGPTKLGDLMRDAVIESTVLPPGYTIKEADTWRWSDEEREQIYFVLAISILLIYMVTAALFESLVQPLCVLLTVPMALIGVFLMFFYANATFTREAYIGVIMMGGIVVNNAILLVDHINQIRRDGTLVPPGLHPEGHPGAGASHSHDHHHHGPGPPPPGALQPGGRLQHLECPGLRPHRGAPLLDALRPHHHARTVLPVRGRVAEAVGALPLQNGLAFSTLLGLPEWKGREYEW